MTVIDKIQKFCAYQDRSEFEVRKKLKTFPLSSEEEAQIMEQLIHEKFIDDQRFAYSFVNGKMNTKGWAYLKSKTDFFKKGFHNRLLRILLRRLMNTNSSKIF